MYKIERMPHSLEIGYVGEKNFRPVEIDMTAWMEKMPEGVPSIVCIRPGETKDDAYIAVTTFEDNVLTWVPSDADLGVMEGEGMIQVWLEEEENSSVTKRGKSIEVITKVKDSVSNPGADTPAPQQAFLEQMTQLKNATVSAAEDAEDAKDDAVAAKEAAEDAQEAAEAATVHQPYIHSTSKHWMVWDNQTEEYVDTQILAEGQQGSPGDPTQLIDDTAGAGVTNKTLSADKLAEKFGDVLTAIHGMNTATASDVGKALSPKTVADGEVTEWQFVEGGGGSVDPQDIAEAVADWCEENITEDPTVVIDKSLLVDGAAADSKVVGLKVKHFNDELEMTASVDDLLAIATMYHDYKIEESGARVSGGNFDTYEIDYDGTYTTFTVTLYSNTNYLTRAISFINSSSQVISVLQYPNPSSSEPQEFTNQTIPPGTAKILLCNKYTIKEPSATYPSSHSKRIADIETDTSMVSDAISRLNRNLIDKIIEGETLNDNGKIITVDNRNRTDFIPVEPSTYYIYQNAERKSNKSDVWFYTSADISAYITSSKLAQLAAPFKTPSTAHYCIIADGNEYTKYQLEQGETRTEYHPYNYGTVKQENVIEDKIDIILPSKLYALTNQEMNLYFANILEKDWTKYVIECDCGNAHQFNRYLRWNTPTAVERTFNIRVRKDKTIAERVQTLEVVDSSEMTHKSVLILGDSTTSSNTVTEKLHQNINDESLIDTVGTQGTAPYKHEGRAGWKLSKYCANTNGNPFWNPNTQKFDASYYFTQNNISVPDYFIIALGINDIYDMQDDSVIAASKERFDTIIESVKAANQNIRVCISLILPPHDQDGFGEDYPARYYNVIPEYRRKWAKWNRMVIDNYDHRESEGIYVLPINMNLDTVYGMAREEKYVNARSTEKELRSGYGSGVHPNDSGYWQIADVYWAFLCYMSSLET